ncbi:MAG: hypothetical protein FADNKDHG_01122 [Holosporales bacterium]
MKLFFVIENITKSKILQIRLLVMIIRIKRMSPIIFHVLILFLCFLKVEKGTSSESSNDSFEFNSAVWRSINETNYYQTHICLKQKVLCSQSCGIHNKISAVLIFETTNGIFSSFELDGVIQQLMAPLFQQVMTPPKTSK